MKRRIENPIGEHGLHERAGWFVNACLAVVGRSENSNESMLIRRLNLLVLHPPRIGILQERIQRVLVMLLFQALLLLDFFF